MFRFVTLMLLCVLGNADVYAARNSGVEETQKRYALVIGNSAYKSSPLVNPVNDASDIAGKLRKLGFEVTLKTNASQKEMLRAITQFGERLVPGSVALFYYAGHGIQAKGRNYLIPIDAEIAGEAAVRSEAVDVDQLLEQLSPASVSVVILDACRNNPFERSFRGGGGGGLAQIDAPKGTLIAYATAPGKVAADGTGRNGLYTSQLLKALDQPGIKVEDVFKQVRIKVAQSSKDQQIPWEASSLTGDFYFVGRNTINVQVNQSAGLDPETEAWKAAENADSVEAVEAYLKAYPGGKFAAAAGIRMTALKTGQNSASSASASSDKAEDALWAAVEKGSSADDYDAYLSQYPDGKFAALAKNRSAKLKLAMPSRNGDARVQLQTGMRVLGQWGDGFWYPATLGEQKGDVFQVAFDDGDRADLPRTRIRPIDWKIGSRVQCNWNSYGRYYQGTITRSNGDLVHINYDDGDQENTSIGKCRSR